MSAVVPFQLTSQKRHEEDSIHKAVTNFLSWSLPREACWFPIPNGGWRWRSEAERMKGLGQCRAGVPDLCVVYEGHAMFFELKTERGVLSPTQRQMHQKLSDAGADVYVARRLEDVQSVLLEAGVRLRGKTI